MKPPNATEVTTYIMVRKKQEFLWNSSLENLEGVLKNSCFNQNIPYATIMVQKNEKLIVNIQMEFF